MSGPDHLQGCNVGHLFTAADVRWDIYVEAPHGLNYFRSARTKPKTGVSIALYLFAWPWTCNRHSDLPFSSYVTPFV